MQRDRYAIDEFRGTLRFRATLARTPTRLGIRDEVEVSSNKSTLVDDKTAAKVFAALGAGTHIYDNFIDPLRDRRNVKHEGLALRRRLRGKCAVPGSRRLTRV